MLVDHFDAPPTFSPNISERELAHSTALNMIKDARQRLEEDLNNGVESKIAENDYYSKLSNVVDFLEAHRKKGDHSGVEVVMNYLDSKELVGWMNFLLFIRKVVIRALNSLK